MPVLKGVLPTVYLTHLMLLVNAIWMLLHESIVENYLSFVHIILIKFGIDMEKLYGVVIISYSVHLMLHLCRYS